jgi:hypothetical protein
MNKHFVMMMMALVGLFSVSGFAGDTVYALKNPTIPGTTFSIAYYAWDCATAGTCIQAKSYDDKVHPCWNGCGFYTNENGICAALGYESAVPGTAHSDEGSDDGRRIQVDPTGHVSGAVAGRTLNGISCVNKVAAPIVEKLVEIDGPTDPKTKAPFAITTEAPYSCGNESSAASSEDGVCKLLGYTRAASHSSLSQDCPNQFPVEQVDAAGNVLSTQSAFVMNSLICVQ